MTAPRIVLFALTGFGNTVLPALCASGLKPELLVTRAETGPFPYYDEEPLTAVAERLGVPYLFGAEGEQKVAGNPPDIVLCATYHRLLRAPLLQAVRWAINLHPSLLPKYRGPNPFYWVIRNGEASTGVTAHLMTNEADGGPILWSEAIDIMPHETQGSLRRRLAGLAAQGTPAVLFGVQDGTIAPIAQDEVKATAYGRPQEFDRVFNPEWTVDQADRMIRAFSPSPGVTTGRGLATGVLARELASQAKSGNGITADMASCRLKAADGDIVVQLSAPKPA